jgi:hypothetical protein
VQPVHRQRRGRLQEGGSQDEPQMHPRGEILLLSFSLLQTMPP